MSQVEREKRIKILHQKAWEIINTPDNEPEKTVKPTEIFFFGLSDDDLKWLTDDRMIK